jgi:hypothetical protein
MAKAAKKSEVRSFVRKTRKKLGRHAKKDTPNKKAKNYKKAYAGQGKRR